MVRIEMLWLKLGERRLESYPPRLPQFPLLSPTDGTKDACDIIPGTCDERGSADQVKALEMRR